MLPLSKNQSSGMAVGLLVLCLTISFLLLFIPVNMLHRHYDQALDSLFDYLGRYQRIAESSAEVRTALDHVKKMESRKHFLKNTGAALAASEIQETAKSLIEAGGGKLISMQVVPFKDEGGYRRITVNIQLTSNMTTLRKILYSVETGQPYLLVDNASIRTQANPMLRGVPGAEPEVVVQFDLSGYALAVDGK